MSAMDDLGEQWKLWQECLEGEDTNSIFNQVTLLTLDTAIFRLIIEGRHLQMERHPDQPKVNLRLHNFVDRTFFQSQVSSIRRLIEPSKLSNLRGPRGVFSLSALLKDMSSHQPQITREKYFILRKLPYDYQEIIESEKSFSSVQAQRGISSYSVPQEYNWEISAETHTLFDQWSGTSRRSPNDVIHEKVFTKLKDKLLSFKTVTKYVDKYIAHAATPDSRRVENVDKEVITWKYLWDVHQSLFEIADYLALILSGVGHSPLVWKSPTMFEFWDTPFISTPDMPQLELAWDKYQEEIEEWIVNGANRVWAYINS